MHVYAHVPIHTCVYNAHLRLRMLVHAGTHAHTHALAHSYGYTNTMCRFYTYINIHTKKRAYDNSGEYLGGKKMFLLC